MNNNQREHNRDPRAGVSAEAAHRVPQGKRGAAKGKKNGNDKKFYIITVTVGVIVIAASVYAGGLVAQLRSEDTQAPSGATPSQSEVQTTAAPVSETVPETTAAPAETEYNVPSVRFVTDLSAYEKYMNPEGEMRDAFLLLVNSKNTLSSSYVPTELENVKNTRADGRAKQQLVSYAAKALEAMFKEMYEAGYTDVTVTSGYRTYAYQQQLFSSYTNKELSANSSLTKAQAEAIVETYSARPGTSEHQSGLCIDMHNLGSADKAFAKQKAYTWLYDNAWKFGFILRFPEDKTDITGISFEPWHYRYVGRYHAWKIHDLGICLEEYIELLNK